MRIALGLQLQHIQMNDFSDVVQSGVFLPKIVLFFLCAGIQPARDALGALP
jgi:hypothetical protein